MAAVCAPLAVIVLEVVVLRTGLLRRGRFWAAVLVTLAFQVPVDGWLTRLPDPIVSYSPSAISGIRWPWDIPVEDFGFGFAMTALTLLLWQRARQRAARGAGSTDRQREAQVDRG